MKKKHLLKILSSLIVKFSGLESKLELLSNAINWFDCLTVNSAGSVSASASNGLWIIRFITLWSV